LNDGVRPVSLSPMFPLGGPLMPGALLPLQVFEPRYLELIDRCLVSRSAEFGVVMIERGSEVGGGDVRTNVGTAARIVEVKTITEGRLAVLAVGQRRIEVVRWLDDDPFPRAEVRDWPDEDLVDGGIVSPSQVADLRVTAMRGLDRVRGLVSELGVEVPERPDLDDLDPVEASYAVATLAPLGSADRQRLLCAGGVRRRFELFSEVLSEVEDSLRFRLLNSRSDD